MTRLLADSIGHASVGGVETVTPFNQRVRPSGTTFSYAPAETQVLGLVLRGSPTPPAYAVISSTCG